MSEPLIFEPVPESPTAAADSSADPQALEVAVVDALKTIFDPEIPVNIYELGLIYDLDISPEGAAAIKMTLTSPACPVAGSLPGEVQQKALSVAGITAAEVELVWDPVWNPSMMSEAAKLELGMF
jgi:FeS assembly SUF system protein